MRLKPLADRVLIKRLPEEETTRGGIIIPDSAKEKPQRGEVVAVGHGKYDEKGEKIKMELEEGDQVLFGKYAGTEIKLEGDEFIIMRQDDVLGILKADKN